MGGVLGHTRLIRLVVLWASLAGGVASAQADGGGPPTFPGRRPALSPTMTAGDRNRPPPATCWCFTLGLIESPWDRAHYGKLGPLLGDFDDPDFDPEKWKAMTERDAAWMARLLARFGPDQIRALVDQRGGPPR